MLSREKNAEKPQACCVIFDHIVKPEAVLIKSTLDQIEKNIKRYYQEQLQTIQVVNKQDTTAFDLSNVPTTLPLKWLTDKPFWVK